MQTPFTRDDYIELLAEVLAQIEQELWEMVGLARCYQFPLEKIPVRFRQYALKRNVILTVLGGKEKLRLALGRPNWRGEMTFGTLYADIDKRGAAKSILGCFADLSPKKFLRILRRVEALLDHVRKRRQGLQKFLQDRYQKQQSIVEFLSARLVLHKLRTCGGQDGAL